MAKERRAASRKSTAAARGNGSENSATIAVDHSPEAVTAQRHWDSIPAEVKANRRGLTNDDIRVAAKAASKMAEVIGDLLPILGRLTFQADPHHITESAFSDAAAYYTVFERVRNPLGYPWPGPRGSFEFEAVTGAAITYWMKLCAVMESACEHYGWQSLSELRWDKGRAFPAARAACRVRDGVPLPPILPETIGSIVSAAKRLLEIVGACEDCKPKIDNHQNDATQRDTLRDSEKKTLRQPTRASIRCSSDYQKQLKSKRPLKKTSFIREWCVGKDASASSITRISNDHPELFPRCDKDATRG